MLLSKVMLEKTFLSVVTLQAIIVIQVLQNYKHLMNKTG